MVAGHLQTKKGYYYMVLNLKSEDGNRKSKWISTGIPATGKKSAKLAEEMLAETRCTYKDAASPCALHDQVAGYHQELCGGRYICGICKQY